MRETLILGSSYPVFIGVTLICMCGCSILIGRALAQCWRPARHALPYGLLLGIVDRLVDYLLFGGQLASATGFVIDTYFILLAAMIAYRTTLAGQMVRQYPWLYRRFLVIAWQRIPVPAE